MQGQICQSMQHGEKPGVAQAGLTMGMPCGFFVPQPRQICATALLEKLHVNWKAATLAGPARQDSSRGEAGLALHVDLLRIAIVIQH